MPERIVYWRALADFSKVRTEAAKTKISLKALNDEADKLSSTNERLGKSEDTVARKVESNGNTVSSAVKKVADARKDSASATLADLTATAKSNVESTKTIKAKQAEAKAANDVAVATERVRQARDNQERSTTKLNTAEAEFNRLIGSGESKAKDLVNAQKELQRAREQEAKSIDKVKIASVGLQTARQREASVAAENAYQVAKDAEAYKKAEESKAKAAETTAERNAAALERQNRIDARVDKLIAARKDAAEQRDIKTGEREAAREEKNLQDTIRRNGKLMAEFDKLAAARAAAQGATRYSTPNRSNIPLTQRVTSIQATIARKPEDRLSNVQVTTANALTRAETQLKAARDAEATTYARINAAEEKLAIARANTSSASAQARSAEADYNDAVKAGGDSSARAIETDGRRLQTKNELLKAENSERDASNGLTRAKNGVAEASDRVTGAETRLAAAVRKAEQEFRSGGSGGNIFTRSMKTLEGWFNKADSAAGKLARGLAGIRWPALAGGVYLLVEAVSVLVSGLFALGSAIAPAIGGLAAAIPVAYALGGAFLSVRAAFSGIKGVLQAYRAEQLKASVGGDKAANAAVNNADAIKSAQQALSDARANVGITAEQGAQSVVDASRTIVDAQAAELSAQQGLNDARKQAKQNIIDLKNAVIDAALAERGAALDLADAQANLQHVLNDPNASRADRDRAQLQVDVASKANTDAGTASTAAQAASTAASTAGVNGDSGVIAAKKQLADSIYAVNKAERDYRDTVASTSRANAKAIRDVTNAENALAKAQRTAAIDTGAAATAANTYKAKLAALSPAARKFVEKLISMKNYWNQIKATAAANLFPGLTKGLDQLKKVFPVMKSGIATISRTVGDLGNKFAHMITTPRWINSFKQLNAASTPILKNLGDAFMHILDALRAVATAAIPLAKKLTKGFDEWTASIDKAANAGEKSGKMTKFFEHSYNVIHQLGQILKNIGIGFFNMGKAASGAGQSMLDSIQQLTKKWSDWTGSVSGQNELKKYFADARDNMRYIDHLIWRITVGFLGMGDNKNFKPILKGLGDIWQALKDAFGGQGNTISGEFVGLLHTIANTIRAIAKNSSGLQVFLGVLSTMLKLFNGFIQLPGMGFILGTIFAGFAAFKALKLLGVIAMVRGLGKAFAFFKRSAAGTGAAAAEANTAMLATETGGGGAAAVGAAAGGKTAAVKRGATGVEAGVGAGLAGAATKGKGALTKLFVTGEGGLAKGGIWGIAIAAIIAALVVAYVKWKWFHNAVNSLMKNIWKIIHPILKFMVGAFKDLGKAFGKLWSALQPVVKLIKPLLPLLKYLAIAFGIALVSPILAVATALTAIALVAGVVAKVLAWAINNIIIPVINALVVATKAVVHAIVVTWNALARALSATWNVITSIFRVAAKIIWGIVSVAFKIIAAVILLPLRLLIAAIEWVWSKIGGGVTAFWNKIWNFLKTLWTGISTFAGKIWNSIKDIILAPIHAVWGVIKTIWNGIWTWLSGFWNNTIGKGSGKIWGNIAKGIQKAFGAVTGFIQKIWDGIQAIFTKSINFITQKILNKLIHAVNWVVTKFGISKIGDIPPIGGSAPDHGRAAGNATVGGGPKKLAKGGVLPGYTPGRDPHKFVSNTGLQLHLSGGEGILTPETTRAIGGKRGIDSLNRKYTNRLGGSRKGHFAGGGIFDPGSWLDDIGNVAGTIIGAGGAAAESTAQDGFNSLRSVAAWSSKKSLQAAEAPIRALINTLPVKLFRNFGLGSLNTINSAVYNFIKGKQSSALKGHGSMGDLTKGSSMDYAKVIVGQAENMGLTSKAAEIALMTALVESNLKNYANSNIPESLSLPHDAVGSDHYSAGLFQQQTGPFGNYWGSVAQVMNPAYSAGRFYQELVKKAPGYNNMDPGVAAQTVQVSAFPAAYDQRKGEADALLKQIGFNSGGASVSPRAVANGGVLNFHTGGVVPYLNKGSAGNPALSALYSQAGIAFPGGNWGFGTGLQSVYKKRLTGVNTYTDVASSAPGPKVEARPTPDSWTTRAMMNYVDRTDPTSYSTMWSKYPYANAAWPNAYHKNPLGPILSYMGGKTQWTNFRKNKDAAQWATLAGDDKKYDAAHKRTGVKYDLTSEKKRHPWWNKFLSTQESQWNRSLGIVGKASTTEVSRIAYLRSKLHLAGAGNNAGLYSSDMQMPMDHAAAHALSVTHPADWPHPWSGPVTATESALADSERSNALNAEWFSDLNTIATWGYEDLINYLLDKGVADGLSIARSAVADKTTAKQLNDSIHAGVISGGVNGDDQTMILKIISKLGSGQSSHPFGLRDVAADLNVADYIPVNLFDKMSAQLAKLPDSLTGKFKDDVAKFRAGTFFANIGGVVPGNRGYDRDTQPAMLTPGEGVLTKRAMTLLGESNLHRLNNGIRPQTFAAGGVMLAPTFDQMGLGNAAMRGNINARNTMGGRNGGMPGSVVLETNIYNPTGESSVYSQNKALQRQAALGTIAKVAGQNG